MIDRYVKQQGRDTITQNGDKDKVIVRYARVPSKTKSYDSGCPFCQMLASRGFVYESEKSAGGKTRKREFGAYHDFCNCQPVPAFSKASKNGYGRRIAVDVSIPGYDPDKLYGEYLENLQRFKKYRSESSRKGKGGKNKGAKKSPFASIYDMCQYLRGAKTRAELKARCETVEKYWDNSLYSKKSWIGVCQTVNDIRGKLAA